MIYSVRLNHGKPFLVNSNVDPTSHYKKLAPHVECTRAEIMDLVTEAPVELPKAPAPVELPKAPAPGPWTPSSWRGFIDGPRKELADKLAAATKALRIVQEEVKAQLTADMERKFGPIYANCEINHEAGMYKAIVYFKGILG